MKRAPAGTKLAWASEAELHTLKASTRSSVSSVSASLSGPPIRAAHVHSEARDYAVKLGVDPQTPGVLDEISSFLSSQLPDGWQKFESDQGIVYYATAETSQWEHPAEARILSRFENCASFAGSPLWLWQMRKKLLAQKPVGKVSLVRAWKRRPTIRVGSSTDDDSGEVAVELLAGSEFPKLNYKLVKVFARYFSVFSEDIGRASFLLKIASVCPLPLHVKMDMRDDGLCVFSSDQTGESTRHPCDNFFQIVFDGMSADDLPATPVTQFLPEGTFFNWETDAVVLSDAPFKRRELSRAFLTVVDMIEDCASRTTIIESAFQGICTQNISLVLTALGDVTALVRDAAKRNHRSTEAISTNSLDDTTWTAVTQAVLSTLKACAEVLTGAEKVRSVGKSAKRPAEKPKPPVLGPTVKAFAINDDSDEAADSCQQSSTAEEEELEEEECEVTFSGLQHAMEEYPTGAQLFTADLLEQLTMKELVATVKLLGLLGESGNGALVKAMEERDDLNAELVELSNKLNSNS